MATDLSQGGPLLAVGVRRFAVAWRNPSEPAISPVGTLTYTRDLYRFGYLAAARDIEGFRPLLSFPDWSRSYESEALFPLFSQRVMDRKRPEFHGYLQALDLPQTASDLDILGRSGGRRKGDNVQVVEAPHVQPDGSTSHDFLIHGLRHTDVPTDVREAALANLQLGSILQIRAERQNPVNPNAMVVLAPDGTTLGWIPDLLLDYAQAVVATGGAKLTVRRANGPEVASEVRLVVRLAGFAPPGYQPFVGPQWQMASDRDHVH
jgi:hypothetical protein